MRGDNSHELQLAEKLLEHIEEEASTEAPFKQYRLLLPPDLAREVQQFSKKKGISMAELIRYSLRLYLTLANILEPGSKLIVQTEGKSEQVLVIPFL